LVPAAFFTLGFLAAAGFLTFGFLAATFFGFFSFFSPNLNDPDAPTPFDCLSDPLLTPFFNAILMC